MQRSTRDHTTVLHAVGKVAARIAAGDTDTITAVNNVALLCLRRSGVRKE